MRPREGIDIRRDKDGSPIYTLKVYDIDKPVNARAFKCVFLKQGHNLEQLRSEALRAIFHYGEKPIKEKEVTK